MKVKAGALHGFVLCSDGRLYHPFICEQAAIAWEKRKADRVTRSRENDRKAREREARAHMCDDLRRKGVPFSWNIGTSALRDLHRQHFQNGHA